MGEHPNRIAIVDDDPSVARALRRLVASLGHEAFAFTSGHALLHGMTATPPTHVLLDLHMPAPAGPTLVAGIHARWPEARILIMSGLQTDGAAEACRAAGAMGLLRKPLLVEDIEAFLLADVRPTF